MYSESLKGSYPFSSKLFTAIFISALLAFSLPAFAKKEDKLPIISEVYVGTTTTIITGSNFDNPDVILGESGFVTVISSTDTMIEVETPAVPDGDYKLIVSQGRGGKDFDEFG